MSSSLGTFEEFDQLYALASHVICWGEP